jgi:hypothetical protein
MELWQECVRRKVLEYKKSVCLTGKPTTKLPQLQNFPFPHPVTKNSADRSPRCSFAMA